MWSIGVMGMANPPFASVGCAMCSAKALPLRNMYALRVSGSLQYASNSFAGDTVLSSMVCPSELPSHVYACSSYFIAFYLHIVQPLRVEGLCVPVVKYTTTRDERELQHGMILPYTQLHYTAYLCKCQCHYNPITQNRPVLFRATLHLSTQFSPA